MANKNQTPEEKEEVQVAHAQSQESHLEVAARLEGTDGFSVDPVTGQPHVETPLEQDNQGLTELHYIMKQNDPKMDVLPEDFIQYTVAGQLKNMPEKKSVGTIKPGDTGAVK